MLCTPLTMLLVYSPTSKSFPVYFTTLASLGRPHWHFGCVLFYIIVQRQRKKNRRNQIVNITAACKSDKEYLSESLFWQQYIFRCIRSDFYHSSFSSVSIRSNAVRTTYNLNANGKINTVRFTVLRLK